ncbi:MAG: thiolase domain-containing protein [Actinomycetota bacterium]
MRDVAVVAFAQAPSVRADSDRNEIEILLPVIEEVIEKSGVPRGQFGFTISGSCDYLAGQPFAFVQGLEAIGAWPPIEESHVEMDGAWALYEAWVRLQEGDIDTALVYCFGKSSMGELAEVMSLQLDPYLVAPLWPDAISLAALQARMVLDAGKTTEQDMAEIAMRSRRDALNNPNATVQGSPDVEILLKEPYLVSPLRKHDCPPISDGAAAIVLAAGDKARSLTKRPAWIKGIDHRIEAHTLGARDLTTSASTKAAASKAGANGAFDIAELHAPFTHQELILRDALSLDANTRINPSGGALAANPMMVAGLIRVGEAATRIQRGEANRALAHATSGPCLQQNLVCVLEADR